MLSSVLNTPVAVEASVQIARSFVRLREVLATHKELASRLDAIERRIADQGADLGQHAEEIRKVFEMINQLMDPPVKLAPRIGFKPQSS